jgi:hypothetical protein
LFSAKPDELIITRQTEGGHFGAVQLEGELKDAIVEIHRMPHRRGVTVRLELDALQRPIGDIPLPFGNSPILRNRPLGEIVAEEQLAPLAAALSLARANRLTSRIGASASSTAFGVSRIVAWIVVERPFKAAMPAFERAFRVAQADSLRFQGAKPLPS